MILRDSYPFLSVLFTAIILSIIFKLEFLGIVFLILFIFVLFFFRNPERNIPNSEDVILSPADGKVIKVSTVEDESEKYFKNYIAIFMTVFNVHVNKSPIEGEIIDYKYFEGKFKPAFDSEASFENEHNFITVRGKEITVKFSQIAGIIARRIVFWKKVGDYVKKGENIGLIKFGSRVDLYLPENVEITVKEGDWVRGGESIVAKIKREQVYNGQ